MEFECLYVLNRLIEYIMNEWMVERMYVCMFCARTSHAYDNNTNTASESFS